MANPFAAEVARTLADIAQTKANIARDQALLAKDPGNARLQQQITSGQAYLVDLDAQLAIFQEADASSTASSGQVVTAAQQARDDGATTQSPQPAQVPIIPAGRVNQNLENVETGTDAPTRTLAQTQSTPQPAVVPFATKDEDGNPLPGTPSLNAGVGANRDDNTAPTANSTQQSINAAFNQKIITQPNILDKYTSYTYSISWYLLGPNNFNEMQQNFKKNISKWQLLMQSGGAPTQASGGTTAGRNQFFDLDFYLDNLEIETKILGKGTLAGSCAASIKFTVTEPNGVTLSAQLARAVQSILKQSSPKSPTTANTVTVNPVSCPHCLCIRFYGYDDQGNLVTPIKGQYSPSGSASTTDPQAIVEKWFPFVINEFKFKLANKLVEYQITGNPLPYYLNKSQDRGTIPFAFELLGETVSDVMIGKAVGTKYPPADDGRSTSPSPAKAGPQLKVKDLSIQQQAAIAAGTDPNAVNDQGMAFGGGGLSG